MPAQSASVEGNKLASAQLPKRKDRVWHIELAPLTRPQAWKIDEVKPRTRIGVLGFAFSGEQDGAVLRAESLFVAGKAYAMRSSRA